ncbi:MAG: hypothetical protein K2N05_12835 [Muribaculaceae bacterium]|nr:hypothetical protein [Muribaculaceae bacterium]
MKTFHRINCLICAFLLAQIISFIPIQGATITHRFEYAFDDISIKQTKNYSGADHSLIEMTGLKNQALETEPLLPRESRIFRIPPGATDLSLRITNLGKSISKILEHPLCPMVDMPTSNTVDSVNSMTQYSPSYLMNQIVPEVVITDDFFLNGNEHYVEIVASPICYNGPAKTITIYSSIDIELSYTESADGRSFTASNSSLKPRMFRFDDYVPCTNDYSSMRVSAGSDEMLPSTYVVLVPETLKTAMTRFVNWKQQKGYNVIVQTVEEILNNPLYAIGSSWKCFDKESSVREWLRDTYYSNGAYYCLIVGDYRTSAPIRKFSTRNRGLSDPNDERYLPTDAYFCDLVSDWSFTKDESGIYSTYYQFSGFSPTISVGRLLASENEEIENFTDKVIMYELYPGLGDSSYLTNGFIGKHYDSISSNKNNENLFKDMTGFSITQIDGVSGETMADTSPNSKQVLDCWKNAGLATLQYHGGPICVVLSKSIHGWPNSHAIMAMKEYRGLENGAFLADQENVLDYLDNKKTPSIVYSLACTVAPFDNMFTSYPELDTIPTKPHTFAGMFTVGKNFGGPAFLGNTREGYFNASAVMEQEFGKYVEKGLTLGEAENLSKIGNFTKYDYIRDHVRLVHSIIGDPELTIWRRQPKFINPAISLDNKTLIIDNIEGNDYSVGITSGNFNKRYEQDYVTGSMSISLTEAMMKSPSTGLVSVYMNQKDIWPETFLIPVSSVIKNIEKTYYVNRFVIGKKGGYFNCPSLRAGLNSKLRILSYTDISSSSGVEVMEGASLTLQSRGKISLENDVVRKGGRLTLDSGGVELKGSFTVEKGASVQIKIINTKE